MKARTKVWFYGLISGIIGGVAGAIDSSLALMIIAPSQFNLGPELFRTLETALILGLFAGLKCAVAYLKQSPLPSAKNSKTK